MRYLFNILISFFSPAEIQPEIRSRRLIAKEYRYWRMRIFYSVYIGYVFFYFTRKSFTFVIPAMVEDLNFTYSELGLLSTILYVTYGISKFTSGVLSDKSNPRYFMSVGLILTGVFNVLFGFASSMYFLALFWGLNGWFQGWGWPPITKQLTYWYSNSERGLWWSLCSTAHNVGGALIPLLVAFCLMQNTGWRYAMFVPGILCIFVGLFLLDRLRDIPQTMGLPPVEKYKNDASNFNIEDDSFTLRQILFEQVLNNKFVWIMAITYFFVYVIRTAINDWTLPYLVDQGYDFIVAGASIAWFELGGFIGMLVAGWSSDNLFGGRRVPFMLFCTVGMAGALYSLWMLPPDHPVLVYILICAIGFFVYGPQMLIGLAAAEYVDKKAACTANGFVGCWAYAGAAFTGLPLGKAIDNSWGLYYGILISCCVICFIILSNLVIGSKIKAYFQ